MHTVEVLTNRIGELDGNIRTVLTVYMTWYTFYWVLNGTVLAWRYGKNEGSIPRPIGWFFLLMAVPAAISSFTVMGAALRMSAEIGDLSVAVAELVQFDSKSHETAFLRPLWPHRTIAWGLGVNGTATVFLMLIWLWAIGYRPSWVRAGSSRRID